MADSKSEYITGAIFEEDILTELQIQKNVLDQFAIVSITDRKGRITYVNDLFCKISKYSKKELIGQGHHIVSSGYHSKEFFRNMWKTIERGGFWREEIKNAAKDGNIYWVDTCIFPFKEPSGDITKYVAICLDLTKKKEDEQHIRNLLSDLSKKNEELKTFIYTISHDLRSPLVTIKGFLDIIGKDPKIQEDRKLLSYMSRVFRSSEYMDFMIKGVLDVSRVGKLVLENFVVKDIIESVKESLYGLIKNSEAKIETNISSSVVYGDKEKIKSVFQNLIENAIKYRSKEKPIIYINIREEETHFLFSVKDNGIGIDSKRKDNIFILFNKVENKKMIEGYGVGLCLAKKIVENHKGRIWVKSEGRDKGSTFYFTISKRIGGDKTGQDRI